MKKLILFGDSLLAGYIDGHATNIVTQGLQEKLPNFTIINNSVPGSTTEEAIDFYDLRIKPFNYDLVILALGTNDANMQFGLSAGRYAHNLQVLVDLIGVDKTILMGPSYTNWKIAKDQAWPKTLQFELVAEQCHIENNIPFLNFAKVMRETWSTKQGKVHVTPSSHACVITGYNKKKGIVYVNDPYGVKNKKVSLKKIEASYNQQGKQALYIE